MTKTSDRAKRKRQPAVPKRATEVIEISKLTDHPDNYRGHSQDQLDHIKSSIRANGVYRNVIIAKDNVILGGHGVVQAARQMKLRKIQVIRLPWKSTDPRSLKVLTGDNEISRLAGVDDRALTNLLKKIKESEGVDLMGTGFDEQMLAALVMVTRTSDEIEDFDAAAEWTGMPEHDPGNKAYRLIIQFRNEDDRLSFMKHADIDSDNLKAYTRGGQHWSTWWPPKERNDLASVRFEDGETDAEETPS